MSSCINTSEPSANISTTDDETAGSEKNSEDSQHSAPETVENDAANMAINKNKTLVSPSRTETTSQPMKIVSSPEEKRDEGDMDTLRSPSIHILYDDCIAQILTFLPLSDLTEISETCTRLQSIARSVFIRRHRILFLGSCDGGRILCRTKRKLFFGGRMLCDCFFIEGRPVGTLNLIRRILLNFGSCIAELVVDYERLTHLNSNRILSLISNYPLESLESLHLKKFHVNEEMAVKLKPIISKLKKLKLCYCTLDMYASAELFSGLNELVTLQIFSTTDFDSTALTYHFPKLKDLYMSGIDDIVPDHVEQFIKNHEHLEDLRLFSLGDLSCNFIPTAAQSMKKLRSIGTIINDPSINSADVSQYLQHITKLEHLEKLSLCYSKSQKLSFFINEIATVMSKSLKQLALVNVIVDDQLIEAISKIESLEGLHLFQMHGLSEKHLYNFARLNKLTELEICFSKIPLTQSGLVKLIRQLDKLEVLNLMASGFVMDQSTNDAVDEIRRSRIERGELHVICKGITSDPSWK